MTDTHDMPCRGSDAWAAIEELRRLLDERVVEWSSIGGDTAWFDSRGWTAEAVAESVDGTKLYVTALMTPAQAVEATLGRGTCRMDHEDGNDTWWSCSVCDADVYLPTKPKFCWNCGREVVE